MGHPEQGLSQQKRKQYDLEWEITLLEREILIIAASRVKTKRKNFYSKKYEDPIDTIAAEIRRKTDEFLRNIV